MVTPRRTRPHRPPRTKSPRARETAPAYAVLTIEEIYRRYPDEWVVLDEPVLTPNLDIIRGTVIAHSKDRDEVYTMAHKLNPKFPAFLYTGGIPEGTAIILWHYYSIHDRT